ncbi:MULTISPECIES: molecular chaperone [Ramlibacter]|uniref:Fimbria/pilus periplasmic chaperone n=1 Tax=Ramlibacter pinisoli TaxID=2682844 RepID=A0A6N8IUA6_9BURK|nr:MULTISPECIES: fimbria/pilus periplasmic chaperone [Ramlibacter]MBA2965318.1 molecular chaperone [Ramlibacter sp. CGMCC 1.13660]MVQ30282.1 fimbria/pilus periplasmic chaperone [Ramlibacter pinisoli]
MNVRRLNPGRGLSCIVLGCALVAGLLPAAHAGSFSVSPVRIFMQPRERATAVTVANEGTTDLVMQADVFEWTQGEDGADKLTPTEDIILAPPILKIAPGSRQVVRLANLRPPPTDAQKTYRLIVREVPEAQAQASGINVQVALAFSLPVFITPPNAKPTLVCQSRRSNPTTPVVTCENTGQAYVQPVNLSLAPASGETLNQDIRGGYILPQVRRSFDLPAAATPLRTGPAKLTVTLDDGSKQTFDVQLTE